MCIGIPMQVVALQPGWADVVGRGERKRVNTALVGEPAVGEWLLIFLDSARERLSAERAAEVHATLDLVEAAMGLATGLDGTHLNPTADPGYGLPSAMTAAQLAALTGQTPPAAAPAIESSTSPGVPQP